MPSKLIKVPFNRSGVLMHYADPHRETGYDAAHEWREPKKFRMLLRLHETERGRSAAYFVWKDQDGNFWPMFITDVCELIRNHTVTSGIVEGDWIPRKRGQNFGLRYLGPHEEDGGA